MVKTKTPTVSSLKKKADAAFSEYVRRSVAGQDGYAVCVTCGVKKRWQELQAGHYETRASNGLRFDERNVHPQCVGCNLFKKGNYPRYAIWMVQTYGQPILAQLEVEARSIHQWKAHQLQEIIDCYKGKIAELDT